MDVMPPDAIAPPVDFIPPDDATPPVDVIPPVDMTPLSTSLDAAAGSDPPHPVSKLNSDRQMAVADIQDPQVTRLMQNLPIERLVRHRTTRSYTALRSYEDERFTKRGLWSFPHKYSKS